MSQDRLLQMVVSVLLMAGFRVSERFSMRPRSFDLITSNREMLLVIKVVSHIDSVSEETARDLDHIARYLKGSPLIIGERARDAELERGAVYVRYGIYAVSVATLYDALVEQIPPLVYASPGGLYVNINGEVLREERERRNLSLGDLGNLLGVSRRTISKYESGMGMKLHTLHRAPFQALIEFSNHTILTGYGQASKVVKRAALIGNISQVTGSHAMCVITDYQKQKKIGSTLVIGEQRLHRIADGEELIDMIDNS